MIPKELDVFPNIVGDRSTPGFSIPLDPERDEPIDIHLKLCLCLEAFDHHKR